MVMIINFWWLILKIVIYFALLNMINHVMSIFVAIILCFVVILVLFAKVEMIYLESFFYMGMNVVVK